MKLSGASVAGKPQRYVPVSVTIASVFVEFPFHNIALKDIAKFRIGCDSVSMFCSFCYATSESLPGLPI